MVQRPNTTQTVLEPALTSALRQNGWWITVYADASMDTEDPRGVAEARRRAVLDQVAGLGATTEQVSSLAETLDGTDGVPSPSTRYVLLRDGAIVHSVNLPGSPIESEVVSAGPVPLLVPLLRHRGEEYVYLVVESGKDGGEVSVYRSSSRRADGTEAVQGRTDTLHKFKGGGWAHLRFQHHTEEIWRQTEGELAAVVERLADEHNPRFVVVTGDVQARQPLVSQLSARVAPLVAELDLNTRAAGSSPDAIGDFAERKLNEVADEDLRRDLDRLATELGKEEGAAERGVGWTVHTVQQAQIEVLFLDPAALGERTLLALDAEPWVAAAPEEAAPAKILGDVPAAEALLRAALLTDASVRLVPTALLPDSAGVAGLLRWGTAAPTGG